MKPIKKPLATKRRYFIGKSRRKQKGELSLVEAAGVMAAGALIALLVYMGRPYVMDRIHASEFKSEAQYFRSGIQDATAGEIDYAGVSMLSLTQGLAFSTAGRRLNKTSGTLTGIFGGAVTAAPATVIATNDAIALTYPVPTSVCTLSAEAVSRTYTQVKVNNTTIKGPSTDFSSGTAATACASAGATASIVMYATKDN
ncbi:type 4 pilus major pilin [Burkholderia sp. BCC0405]|uniref:type 4 pilus major pilin n=1 Tax=Burkholderia sp. BCC0405 TaxID=2676298 RepID=UPI00158C9FB0|nr:type 4 pilus major pilin [Burkholderia sp. BCC0405]